jgi:filamentous hemagglutinin family protein
MMSINFRINQKLNVFWTAFTAGLLTTAMVLPATAQMTSDGTTNTTVKQNGHDFEIIDGIAQDNNLFHSFSNFSVPTGYRAIFDLGNTPNITNIFSRVTGNNISNIDGAISIINQNPNNAVNLFLMNPNGIVFGQNASLNISGSFVGTTATSIKFVDGTEFSAVNPSSPPLFTMRVPIGLQMGNSTSQIQVQGKGNDGIVPTTNLGIIASPTKTFALVGGDVTFTGGVITAPSGRIEVGAVGSGTVNLISTPTGWQLDYTQITDLRDINFTQRSALWNPYQIGNPFGGIQVVGRDIGVNQSQIAAATAGTGNASDITVNAGRSLLLSGVNAQAMAPSAWIVNQVRKTATGNGGAVNIRAGDVTLRDGAAIETLSLGAGNAGQVQVIADTITATGAVALKSPLAPTGNSSSRIGSQTFASGRSGDVNVVARKLALTDSGLVGTIVFPGATGRGGNISVDVADEIYATGVSPVSLTPSGIVAYTFGIGNGGNVNVKTGTLNLAEGAAVVAFVVRLKGIPGTGIGSAGDVSVVAQQGINLVGTSPVVPTQLSFLGSSTTGSGNGGNVWITTPYLTLLDGAGLATTTVPVIGNFGEANQSNNLGNSGSITVNVAERITVSGINKYTLATSFLGSGTYGNGKTADVKLQTNQLLVQNGGAIANGTAATGDAGILSIQANSILVEGKNNRSSVIGATAPTFNETTRRFYNLPNVPTGNTGVLNINTQQLTVRDGGNISVTHEGTGNAGQLNITAEKISLETGRISATTASGKGGNISLLLGNAFVLRHRSIISAEAGNDGNGGNITISSPMIVGLENSDIIANAFNGNGGNIQITTQGIFGLQYRPQLTPENDITASSQFGVNGRVDINNFGVDPNSGLVELPVNTKDSSQQIATACSHTTGSSFVAVGRGGIPQNPTQEMRSDRPWSDIRDLSAFRNNRAVTAQIPQTPEVLIQATSWRRNAQGKIELFAEQSPTPIQPTLTCATVPRS